ASLHIYIRLLLILDRSYARSDLRRVYNDGHDATFSASSSTILPRSITDYVKNDLRNHSSKSLLPCGSTDVIDVLAGGFLLVPLEPFCNVTNDRIVHG